MPRAITKALSAIKNTLTTPMIFSEKQGRDLWARMLAEERELKMTGRALKEKKKENASEMKRLRGKLNEIRSQKQIEARQKNPKAVSISEKSIAVYKKQISERELQEKVIERKMDSVDRKIRDCSDKIGVAMSYIERKEEKQRVATASDCICASCMKPIL